MQRNITKLSLIRLNLKKKGKKKEAEGPRVESLKEILQFASIYRTTSLEEGHALDIYLN